MTPDTVIFNLCIFYFIPFVLENNFFPQHINYTVDIY